MTAIAAEVTKRITIRKGFQGIGANKGTALQSVMLQFIVAEAGRAMAAAKIDENISDAALDKLLDVKTNWDRKQYNKKYELMR